MWLGLIYIASKRVAKLAFAMPRLHYGLGVVALVLAAVGVWESVRVPDVKTVEVVLPTLPSEFDGFKLVQLTDLHASRLLQGPWIEAVVAKTNALEPDLTVLTGDMIDGSRGALRMFHLLKPCLPSTVFTRFPVTMNTMSST